ncbi:ricin-type beta-trefoil lectin domain protein [Streptomyces sp. NPDC056160]|uniref:ricin-type beta-trefoil lectin domain protein n=1 Tax=Streptomyces sp. NPDC056160 TaxID=3345731 RepID=UPI0035D77E97
MKSPHPSPPEREVPRGVPVAAPSGGPAPDAASSRTAGLPSGAGHDRRAAETGPVTGGGLPKRRKGALAGKFGSGPQGGATGTVPPADEGDGAVEGGDARPGQAGERVTVPRLTQFSSLGPRRGSTARGTASSVGPGAPRAAGPGRDGAGGAPREHGRAGGSGSGAGGTSAPAGAGRGASVRSLLGGRRRVLLIAAAVAGVALITGAVAGLSGSDGDASARSTTGTVYGPGNRPDVEDLLPDPAASASGSAAPGGPSRSTAPASPGTAKTDASPGAGGTGAAKDGGDPVQAPGGTAAGPAPSGGTAAGSPAGGSGGGPGGGSGAVAPGVRVRSHAVMSRCIDVAGGRGKDGSPLEIRDCSGAASQRWTFASDGTVRAMGLCMDAAGAQTSDGTTVQLANCNGGPAQRFRLNIRHDLVSRLAGKCVDIRDNQTADGSRLQLWSCAGTPNQKWSSG